MSTITQEKPKVSENDQSANPSEVSPFNITPEQEKKMLPQPKDVEGSLIVTGFDKYAKRTDK